MSEAAVGCVTIPAEIDLRRPTMRGIVQEIAARREVSVRDILGRSRLKPISWARQEAMYECRVRTRQSLPQIGAYFGGRDHSTVLHACRVYAVRLGAMKTPPIGSAGPQPLGASRQKEH